MHSSSSPLSFFPRRPPDLSSVTRSVTGHVCWDAQRLDINGVTVMVGGSLKWMDSQLDPPLWIQDRCQRSDGVSMSVIDGVNTYGVPTYVERELLLTRTTDDRCSLLSSLSDACHATLIIPLTRAVYTLLNVTPWDSPWSNSPHLF